MAFQEITVEGAPPAGSDGRRWGEGAVLFAVRAIGVRTLPNWLRDLQPAGVLRPGLRENHP